MERFSFLIVGGAASTKQWAETRLNELWLINNLIAVMKKMLPELQRSNERSVTPARTSACASSTWFDERKEAQRTFQP